MRRILFFILITISVQSFGQSNYTFINGRYRWLATVADSGLHVPRYNGVPSGLRNGVYVADGLIAMDTTNGYFYGYRNGAWFKVANYADIGSTPTLQQVTTAGQETNDYIGVESVRSWPTFSGARYTSNWVAALSSSGGGVNAYGNLVLRENSTGTGKTVTLSPVLDIGASDIELQLQGINGDSIATLRDVRAGGGSSGWSLSGNSLTAGSETGSFIGSTNNVSMRFRTNNTQRFIIDSNGTVLLNKAAAFSSGDDAFIIKALSPNLNTYALYIEHYSGAGMFWVDNNYNIIHGPYTTTTFGASSVLDMTAATVSATNINFGGYAQFAEISTPSTPSSGFGRVYFKSDNLPYAINDAGTEMALYNPKPSLNKGVFIASPTSADTIDVWQTPVAITITSLKAILRGSSSPSVTYNIGFGTNIQSPTAVFTADITCTSITTGCSNSSGFNDATIPAGSFIWIYTTAQSGTVRSIAFTINYTED